MFWIALAAAAQLSAPEPKFVWFNLYDTPFGFFGGSSATVFVRLNVRPDGTVHSCTVEESSGYPWIDGYTCELSRRRARFRPAISESGGAAYGVYRLPITWAMHDAVRKRSTADLVLTVAALPKGVRSPATVRLMFAVDEQGRLSSCAAEPSRDVPKANLLLVPLACEQLMKTYKAIPARDSAGKLVRSIQDGSVEFNRQR
jgi:hypothetical protein